MRSCNAFCLFCLICCILFSSCSISTYSPVSHHTPERCEPGNLNTSVSMGITLGRVSSSLNDSRLEKLAKRIDDFNLSGIYTLSYRFSCFAGVNSNFKINTQNRVYTDGGIAYAFGDLRSSDFFALAMGAGYGFYRANRHHTFYKEALSTYRGFTVFGKVNYLHYYLQPYYFLELDESIKAALSVKISYLRYAGYNIYGLSSLNDGVDTEYRNFDYDVGETIGVGWENGLKFEFGGGNLKFYFEFLLPIGVVSRDASYVGRVPNDSPHPNVHLSLNYTFRLKKKNALLFPTTMLF